MASWEEWLARYEVAYEAVPEDAHTACLNCGHDALRLVFTGNLARAVGWAAFWCDNCLQGITISRVPIPDGAVVRDIYQVREHLGRELPDFEVVTDSRYGGVTVSGDEHVPWLVDPAGRRPRPDSLVQVDAPREVGGFRFATVIDGVAADGAPVVDERRGWITEPARRERILQYLRGGATLFHNAVAFGPDYLEPTRRFAVPTGYRTDGAWIWPMSAEYYLEQHGVAPEPEFYARIRHYGYRCPPGIQQQVDQALATLRERTRMLEERTAVPPTTRAARGGRRPPPPTATQTPPAVPHRRGGRLPVRPGD